MGDIFRPYFTNCMETMTFTEEQLIRMMQGSPEERDEAFKYFFMDTDLERKIIFQITKLGGSEHDAQDAYQEGFKIFYRHLIKGNFEGRSTLSTYFTSICIRCWKDIQRKGFYKRTSLSDNNPLLEEEHTDTPEVQLISKERSNTLKKIIGLLGERCQKVIMMGHQGYSGEELSKLLGLSGEKNGPKNSLQMYEKVKRDAR